MAVDLSTVKKYHLELAIYAKKLTDEGLESNKIRKEIFPQISMLKELIFLVSKTNRKISTYCLLIDIANSWNNFLAYHGGVSCITDIPKPFKKKILFGEVVSISGEKTVSVKYERKVEHPKYGKIIKKSKKYAVHDEKKECSVGDIIAFYETRPLSKTKHHRLREIIKKKEFVGISNNKPIHPGDFSLSNFLNGLMQEKEMSCSY